MYVNAQCTPNPIFTLSPIPGVYPPDIPISGIPLFGINDGQENTPYSQTLTLVVLEDTILDIAFLLDMIDPSITPIMNSAGISTVMTLPVNHVRFDIIGLPSNLVYNCDMNNCQYQAGLNGCIAINGIPTQSGTFPLDVNMTINVQIPTITIPIVGTVIYQGSSQDLPIFTAQQYNLLINPATGIKDVQNKENLIYPNPFYNSANVILKEKKDIKIYDQLGRLIYEKNDVHNNLQISKDDLGEGVFMIEIIGNRSISIQKIIVN